MKKEFKLLSTREESNVLILTYQCIDNPMVIETVFIADENVINAIKTDQSEFEHMTFDIVNVMLVDTFSQTIKPDTVSCMSVETEEGKQWVPGFSPEDRIQAKYFGDPVRH